MFLCLNNFFAHWNVVLVDALSRSHVINLSLSVMECVSDKYRSVLGSVYWMLNSLGYIFLIWSAYLIRHEVYLQLVYAVVQLPIFLYWL